jgi:hypothetical protein
MANLEPDWSSLHARSPTARDADRRSPMTSTIPDELAKLRGRQIGPCVACGRPVFFEHNFTRLQGRVVHVRCPISAGRAPSAHASLLPLLAAGRDG